MTVTFTPRSALEAMSDQCSALEAVHFIDVEPSAASQAFLHISVIDAFCRTVSDAVENKPDTRVVICPHDDSESSLRNAVLLYGAYRLLCEQGALETVVDDLRAILKCLPLGGSTIIDAWSALDRARALRWLAAPDCTLSTPVSEASQAAPDKHTMSDMASVTLADAMPLPSQAAPNASSEDRHRLHQRDFSKAYSARVVSTSADWLPPVSEMRSVSTAPCRGRPLRAAL